MSWSVQCIITSVSLLPQKLSEHHKKKKKQKSEDDYKVFTCTESLLISVVSPGFCYLRSVALCDVSFGNSPLHILAKTLLLNKLHKRYNDALCVAKLYTVTVNRRPIKHTYDLTTAKTNIYSYMAYPPTHTVCTHPRAQLSDACSICSSSEAVGTSVLANNSSPAATKQWQKCCSQQLRPYGW